MDYKKIIADSWEFTQQNKRLIIWFGFFPAIFTTAVSLWYVFYQFFAFKNSFLFSQQDSGFLFDVIGFIWEFLKTHTSWTWWLIVLAVLFGICYFLMPTLAKASAIQYIARKRNGQEATLGTGLRHGLMAFLRLFEYHLLIKTFGFFSILIEMSFVLRNLGPDIFKILMPVFIIFIVLGLFFTLLFTFSDFYIVIDGDGVFESMKKSGRLVFMNWKHTFLITVLMLIIGVRIIIQAIMVFLIPILIVLITGYLATITLPITGILVGGFLGVIFLMVSAYLNGIVDVFSFTVWTYTFLEISAEEETSARDSQ